MLFNKLAFHAFCYSYPTLLELVVAHFVVTLVSAIVRKLALKEAERFGSNESAYLTCLCVARAQIPPNFLIGQDTARVCIALFESTAVRRFVFECRVASVVKQITCGSPSVCVSVCVLCCARAIIHAILDPALRRSEASLQRKRCHAENAPRVI
jgi:hypothetical protein